MAMPLLAAAASAPAAAARPPPALPPSDVSRLPSSCASRSAFRFLVWHAACGRCTIGKDSAFSPPWRRTGHCGLGFGLTLAIPVPGMAKRVAAARAASTPRPVTQPRFIQHKLEAFWFYRFLSLIYDGVVNPGHWTEDMREDALELADLNDADLKVVDVGGGTGFSTLGIVKYVDAKNVTILDQSPHQLAKARQKEPLKQCTFLQGDAEELPFATDSMDRYISAGSIEYWPDPQRGIREAYRVLKKGGRACLIGPVYPTFWLSRFFADVWMLFPKEEEYIQWFTKAGFSDVRIKHISPKWYRGVRRHGLIMGCSVTGVKPQAGDSPLQLEAKAEDVNANVNPFVFLYRFILGTMAALYYFLLPIYMWIKDQITPKDQPI
eukprot:c21114_g1_i1 orf=261-1397(+)